MLNSTLQSCPRPPVSRYCSASAHGPGGISSPPLVSPLQSRLLAQSKRDTNRQTRGDRPKRTNVILKFASSLLGLPFLSIPSRAYYECHFFERHFLVGHNRAKGARSNSERLQLRRCKLCRSDVRQEIESYDRIHCICPHSLLCAARRASNEQSAAYPMATSLQRRFLSILLHLVHDFDGHRLGLGNWMTSLSFIPWERLFYRTTVSMACGLCCYTSVHSLPNDMMRFGRPGERPLI